jgi:hypothetical protein
MKKLIKHIANHIESDPWDEVLENSDRYLIKGLCIAVIVLSTPYVVWMLLHALGVL